MPYPLLSAIKSIAIGDTLDPDILEQSFEEILSGNGAPEQISAFLMGLAVRGETSQELLAGAKVMRANARTIALDGDVLDTCGTGGLGWTSLNTSTASAIVIAACGGRVAKHGNRSVPPKTGSADVLEALGINLDLTETQFRISIETAGVGFLFARNHHSAMRHVAPIRASLGIRTIFNLLGPLSNPASATHQILGVYDPHWIRPMAEALQSLGTKRAWVVHGNRHEDRALDELSIAGTTSVVEVTPDELREFTIQPEDAGLSRSSLKGLSGGSPESNANAIKDVFDGKASSFRDSVLLNAAAGLSVLGLVQSLSEGALKANDAITSGKAHETLSLLRNASAGS